MRISDWSSDVCSSDLAFARRFGAAALLELDRLRGRAAEPALAIAPPATFKRRFELVSEIDHVEALLFPLRRLAFELQARSEERRAGKECVSTCRSRWSPYISKKTSIGNDDRTYTRKTQ